MNKNYKMSIFRDRLAKFITYLFIIIVIGMFLFPIYYAFTLALKLPVDATAYPPRLLVFNVTWKNFVELFKANNFFKFFMNSVIISTSCVILSILLGTPFAYAISRSKAKWAATVMLIVLILRVIPPVSILIPFYSVFSKLKLLDTYGGVIILYLTFTFPLCVWLMKGAFDDLPNGIEEAAWVDGCSVYQTFLKVSLPCVSEALAAAAVLIFVNSWNEYLYALIVTRSNTKTVPVVINTFMRFDETEYGLIAAAAVVISTPVIIFAILVRKYLTSGMTAGAVKE